MGSTRFVEDRLRAEYVDLLPALQRTLTAIETEVKYTLLPPMLGLSRYERILVKARVKECESAIDSLRRRQESRAFDPDRFDHYSLTSLPDLVGVRVLTFPQRRLEDARRALASRVTGWMADPIAGIASEEPLALKYHGRWHEDDPYEAEIQIMPMLIGLFWEVEHSALYKTSPNLRGIEKNPAMMGCTRGLHAALNEFELEFDRQIDAVSSPQRGEEDVGA